MMRRFLVMILCVMLCIVPLMEMDTAFAATSMAKVDTNSSSGVNLRTSANGTVKGWVPEGTSVEIISTSGNWCRVKVMGTWAPKNGYSKANSTGYIYKPYLATGSNKQSTNLAAILGVTGNVSTIRTRTVLRAGAGNNFGKRATLSAGTRLVVTGTMGSWVKVTVLRSSGYVSGYVPKNAVSRGLPGRVATSCNLRKGGSTSFGSICTIPMGSNVTILYVGSTWSQVRYGNKVGYVSNSYLRVR